MRRYAYQVTGALTGIVLLLIGIFTSTNSTASIGLVFAPVAALLGAFAGDTIQYVAELVQHKRAHSMAKTIGIVFVLVLCLFKFVNLRNHNHNLALASDPTTSPETLVEFLQSSDQDVVRAAAANASIPIDALTTKAADHLLDYFVMSGVVVNPKAPQAVLEHAAWLEPSDFKDETEYAIYQTYVWAPLAKREGLPEPLIHKLCSKRHPSHFLILALLDSPATSCEEIKGFLPQENQTLEAAIQKSLAAKNCTQ